LGQNAAIRYSDRVRFPSIAVASGLVAGSLAVFACGDLFHATDWETLCDHDASAPGCGSGGGKTTGHTSASSTGSGKGVSGGTSGSGGSGGGPDPCNAYCSQIVDGCVNDDPQYFSKMNCENVCESIPHMNDPKTDDIPCRENYAVKVATDTSFCGAAGPSGAGKCGPVCDAYCALMTNRCPSVVGGPSQCGTTCATYDATKPYSTAVVSGNSFACRLSWAVKAFDDATVCPNAGPDSTVCVDGDM
jgi:hypothetical protein